MRLNKDKTQSLVFDFQDRDFSIALFHPITQEEVRISPELKLLGIWFDCKLNMQKTIDEKFKSAKNMLWILRKGRDFGLSIDDLVYLFESLIRSRLEFCLNPLLPILTKTQVNTLERIQRYATKIIVNNYEASYEERLERCKLQTLETRWKKNLEKFANTLISSGRFPDIFKPTDKIHPMQVRFGRAFKERKARTTRYSKNPFNVFIKILNSSDNYVFEFEEN